MHAGFPNLRGALSMNCELTLAKFPLTREVRREVQRILGMWTECRATFGAAGPFLFGAFSAADAYYAPVVRRFVSYDVALPVVARDYVQAIEALPSMKLWMIAALAEHDYVDRDETYRDPPGSPAPGV